MNERVTVTLPEEIVRDIDIRERNRSKFILRAVKNELEQRRREELRRSLQAPHSDSEYIAQEGIDEWMSRLPEGDDDMVSVENSTIVRWIPGKGWVAGE